MDVVLEVKGMSSSHCENAVIDGLLNLNGVKKVAVFLDEGKVNVNYDQTVISLEEICDQIEDLGYEVDR